MPKLGGISSLNPDLVLNRSIQWIMQWERVIRWKNRVDQIRVKSYESKQDFHDVVDVSIAFIQNCYHLRDWIVNSDPAMKSSIKDLFANSLELKCCRDVCNGFKHKTISQPSIDTDPYISQSYDYFAKVLSSGKCSTIYTIILANETEVLDCELFTFVDRCFEQWRTFLLQKKLLP